MKNREFIDEVRNQIGNELATERAHGNLFFRNGVLYSYGSHYPLQFKVNGYIFVNNAGYSSTTAHHIGLCSRDYTVKLPRNSKECDRKTVKRALMDEIDALMEREEGLSQKAWKQREDINERIGQVQRTLTAIG